MRNFKQTNLGKRLIHRYHIMLCNVLPRLIDDRRAVVHYYKRRSGHKPNLSSPKTFSEKQQWYKLNSNNPLMAQCADKYEVRRYIKQCGYENLLNEVYGVYDRVEDLDIAHLPQQFVLKAAHASGWNLIVRDKDSRDWKQEMKTMRLWLKQDIYWSGREWVYRDLKKRILAERYLEDDSGGLLDYKFYCFNGVPQFMQLEVGRFTNHNTRNFYDMHWNLLPFGKELPHDPNVQIKMPTCFEEMKKIASDLSKPFSYVRVDLYQVKGRIYFGELTFFPAGGAPDFVPEKYDKIVGDMWNIEL